VVKKETSQVAVVAADRPTASHVVAVLEEHGLARVSVFDGKKGWAARARRAIGDRGEPLLVLAPSSKLGREQLELAEAMAARGGSILVWASPVPPDADADRVVERLLEQRGAITDSRLRVLAEAARVLSRCSGARFDRVRLGGRRTDLAARTAAALASAGVRGAGKPGKGIATLAIDDDGAVMLQLGSSRGSRLRLSDAETAASALALLATAEAATSLAADERVEPDQEVVELIARPPARLLSETASKRLLGAYGIESGPELLCGSATEAARFWSEIGGPVVLKLVRPELESKTAQDAVITGVSSSSRVRRAYHDLRKLADELAPPLPLGVLVAAQIDGGARFWIALEDHPVFGRLVVGGAGDRPDSRPCFALTVPAAPDAVVAALDRAGVEVGPSAKAALATAVARFGWMAHDLGDRITRAEIHPLVAHDDGDIALALDALIGIAG